MYDRQRVGHLKQWIALLKQEDPMTCERCFGALRECDVCKGDGKVPYMFGDCTECNGTGRVCPTDGKHWKK